MVLLYHIFNDSKSFFVWPTPVNELFHSFLGVDFFFILSGFVMDYAYDLRWDRMSLGGFIKRRLIRLHPMVVMGVLVGAIVFIVQGCVKWDGTAVPLTSVLWAVLLSLFLIPSPLSMDVRGNTEMYPLNGSHWSLFFEYIGSLLYGLMLRRLPTKWLKVWVVISILLLAIYAFLQEAGGLLYGWSSEPVNMLGGLLRMLYAYPMGLLLARLFRERKPSSLQGYVFLKSSVALIVILALPIIGGKTVETLFQLVCVVVFFPAIIWYAARGNATGMRQKVISFIGRLSYPLYAIHFPVICLQISVVQGMDNLYEHSSQPWSVVPFTFIISLVLAIVAMLFYDEPLRRWLTKRLINNDTKHEKRHQLSSIVILICLFTSLATNSMAQTTESQELPSIDFSHARLGVWTDGVAEYKTRELFPKAKYVQLDMVSDLVQNLIAGKIDAFLFARPLVLNIKQQGQPIEILPDILCYVPSSFVLPKTEEGRQLCSQLNEFIASIKTDGTMDRLREKWIEGDEDGRTFTKSHLTGDNGTLIIGTGGDVVPFSYIKNNQVTGYEIEIIDLFCAAYGYKYELKVLKFDALLSSLTMGSINMVASYMEWTKERENNALFSDPTDDGAYVMVVRAKELNNESFFIALHRKVKATIVDEDRWKMILQGVGVTLAITLFAALLGTLLGFLVYLLYRENITLLNKAIALSVTALQGLPVLILLMFFYYVVFGSVNIAGTLVAIIVFAIMLSVSVFIMLKSGSESIPKGQMEAALALGFSERRAYLKFILPQVVTVFFPTYRKALIDMMLSTAIVGYVTVQDLTRVGDLIRARTFDAFVPLIVVSIIYLLLSWIMMKAIGALLTRLNPRNRKLEKILKGIKL